MALSIGELFVSLGFDVDDGKLKSFNDGIKTATLQLLELSAVATGGVASLSIFLQGSIDRAFNLKNFASETGQATEGLLRFQSVVNQVNAAVSTEEAASRYRALANAMTDISQQGGGGALARLTGGAFHVGMKEEDVIEAIRNYKQTFIAQNGGGQIGIAAHARLLDQIGVGAGAERAFDVSAEQYRNMSQFFVDAELAKDKTISLGDKIALLNQRWMAFKDNLVGDWALPLISGMDKAEWAFRDFIESVKAIYEAFMKWPPIIRYVTEFLLGALAIWAAPFGATLAVVTAIAAAIWDIGRAIRGLPSITGTVLDSEVKGVKLLFHDPKQFGDNFLATMDRIMGTENRQDQHWFGNGPNQPNVVNQTITAHITTGAQAEDVADAIKRLQQQSHNDAIMSFIGTPAF